MLTIRMLDTAVEAIDRSCEACHDGYMSPNNKEARHTFCSLAISECYKELTSEDQDVKTQAHSRLDRAIKIRPGSRTRIEQWYVTAGREL